MKLPLTSELELLNSMDIPFRIPTFQSVSLVAATFVFGLSLLPRLAFAEEVLVTSESVSNPSNPASVGVGGRIVREDPHQTEVEKERPIHVHTLWESRYVSEGRDNLDGDSLLSASSDLSFGPVTFAPWFAYAPESDYTELNLSLIVGTDVGEDFEVYAGYTHLRFPKLDTFDNEVGVGGAFTGFEFVDIGADLYYSFDAEGSFLEINATKELSLTDKFTISPVAIMGFNAGYIPDGHDGANNLILGLEPSFAISDRIELTGFAGYNIAIDSDPSRHAEDESLTDFFWGAVGIVINF